MIITGIEKQKRSKNRWNVYVDGAFVCGLYEDTIVKYGVKKDDRISERLFEEIKYYDEYLYAKKIALDYLSYRERSSDEIRKKLRSKSVSQDTIEKVLEHLRVLGLVDDEVFALKLIRDRINRRPAGKRLIRQKLFEKGVSKEIGEKTIGKVFLEVDEKEIALKSFTKYYPKIKPKDIVQQKRKVFEYLARRGFGYEVINEIIRENIK